jgi:hypothetical protein
MTVAPIGGLLQVGYATGTDLLLVLSSAGRGIFDCRTFVFATSCELQIYSRSSDIRPVRMTAFTRAGDDEQAVVQAVSQRYNPCE